MKLSVLLIVLLIATATLAQAHALLVSSTPANNAVLRSSPKQVVLRFDARIEKPLTKVTLYEGKHNSVKLPGAANGYTGGSPDRLIIPLPDLKPGSYRLEYRVMASDGHLTPGLVRFRIAPRKTQ